MIKSMTVPKKATNLILQTLRRRLPIFILVSVILIIAFPFRSTVIPRTSISVNPFDTTQPQPESSAPAPAQSSARDLSASDLLKRPRTTDLTTIPKIIHQTWFPAGSDMSESARSWVQTVKNHHPDWEYVLWDDESNEALVREYFPWFLETYKSLPKEINRADMARNFYMFLFGGMYADVDTEALRPVDTLFSAHEVSLAAHWDILSPSSSSSVSGPGNGNGGGFQRAFMGRMAHTLDPEGLGAVPNGWMASPPGHPFWLLPVLYVQENPKGDGSVEGMTGPGILGPLIKQYYSSGKESLRRQLCRRVQTVDPSWDLFCPNYSLETGAADESEGLKHSLVLLPREQIYPFSWVDDGEVKVCLGAKSNPQFDAEECKRRMDVDAWPSYFITYCTHTW